MASNPPDLSEASLTKYSTFAAKFTAQERGKIWNHCQNPANSLTSYLKSFTTVGPVLENDPRVIEAMNLAVSASLITSARKDSIIATVG